MQVRFTRHARQRMLRRRITEREVIEALEAPDELNDGDMGETIAVQRLLDDELRVVYQEVGDDSYLVITVFRGKLSELGSD
jgi:hypothetical protein